MYQFHSGLLFLTKAELQDYLNLNPDTKSWQNHAEYTVLGQEIKMNVFYPVNEISFLKYVPGLSSRTCNFQLVIQLKIKDNSLYAIVKSIQLPRWATPLTISNVYWQIKTEEEWKYLKKISITEIGVFLIFEQKIESEKVN